MQITRFFATPAGGSRFEDLVIAWPDAHADAFGHLLAFTRSFAADCVLVTLPAALDQDWHNAPDRQLVAVLGGQLEVTTSDGARRQWGPGGLFLADDTVGRGHRTRVLEGPARLLFVRLGADFDLTLLGHA
ncbi:MAG: hypothetical protein RLW62_17225 [Gammaproteobacteria bacterium]